MKEEIKKLPWDILEVDYQLTDEEIVRKGVETGLIDENMSSKTSLVNLSSQRDLRPIGERVRDNLPEFNNEQYRLIKVDTTFPTQRETAVGGGPRFLVVPHTE